MLHTMFQGNWPPVPEKKVLSIFGHGGHFGQVTSIM